MAKKHTKTVEIQESDLPISEIIKEGEKATLWKQVVASAILNREVAALSALAKELDARLEATPLESIKKSLIDEGKISSYAEDAKIKVTDIHGDVLTIGMSSKEDAGFGYDKKYLESRLDDLPDIMTVKSVTKLIEKKAFKDLFDGGMIPDAYKGYFWTRPTTKTVISVKTEKEEK